MKDKERIKEADYCHLYIAIRRKKDNDQKDMEWRGELCFRRVIRNEEDDLSYMRNMVSRHPGKWRIYKTINKRDMEMGRKLLISKLTLEPEQWKYRVDSLWKTMLLQPICKAERNILIDVDTKDLSVIAKVLVDNKVHFDRVETPNGFHYVCEKFDTRILEGIKDVEFKRDGYVFVEMIENGSNSI